MNKKVIGILICVILIFIGVVIYLEKNKIENSDFVILDNVPNIDEEKDSVLEKYNYRFYSYQKGDDDYIVFKIWEQTYTTDSIKIESIELEDVNYSNKILSVELNISFKEGKVDPLRDWPLTDEKYIIMKVDNKIEELYVNGREYEDIE